MTLLGLPHAVAASPHQTIDFGALSEENTCVAIVSEDVRIIPSSGDHVTGSSKIRMNNVVDYSWEEKYYAGQLLAVHMKGHYIAYGIKAAGMPNSAIRITNRATGNRALIKGIEGMVEDLSFAYIPQRILLASVDRLGNLQVHTITEDKEIKCHPLVYITSQSVSDQPSRVFWCPYIPEPEELASDFYEEDTSHLLAITRGNKLELWNVNVVARSYGAGPHKPDSITDGFLEIQASKDLITDAAFSPDGTAIATASRDGKCKFYQVYMAGEGEPRCLHEWEPHGGLPVTTLFFLDDHHNSNPDTQFWKYAVTGAKDNSELKLWWCETWDCLQTITLSQNPQQTRGTKFKVEIDLSASYILLSDMYLRMMYVLELQKESLTVRTPFVKTITEFKVPCPILSFGIVEAGPKTFKPNASFQSGSESENEEEEGSQTAVLVKMYLVQPKSLQECHIVFQTNNAIQVHHNTPQAMSIPVAEMVDFSEDIPSRDPPILMTPDAFQSPAQREPSPTPKVTPKAETDSTTPDASNFPLPPIIPDPPVDLENSGNFASGGSSPSREIQEILLTSPSFFQEPRTALPLIEDTTDDKYSTLEAAVLNTKEDLAALTNLILRQSAEIKALREDLQKSKSSRLKDIEAVVGRVVSGAKLKCSLSVDSVSSSISRSVVSSLSSMVMRQFKTELRPAIAVEIESLRNQFMAEVTHKLNLTDQNLKENLGKLLRSKSMVDILSNSLTATANSAMEQVFKETFTNSGIPVFERAATAMFQQINQTFTSGLNEYKKELETYAMKSNDRTNLEVMAVQSAIEQLSLHSQKMYSSIEKETKRLEDVVNELQRSLNRSVALNNGNIRSGAVTPAGHLLDSQVIQSQVTHLIKQGQVNAAFQQALSAGDLNLVMYVCEKVGPQQVFNGSGGCLLQQHVLLSLIQQLSADMAHHTETKHKYLEEAVMCLDANNPDTREHMPRVISSLQKQLQLFYTTHPSDRLSRKAKMLYMATQSLLI